MANPGEFPTQRLMDAAIAEAEKNNEASTSVEQSAVANEQQKAAPATEVVAQESIVETKVGEQAIGTQQLVKPEDVFEVPDNVKIRVKIDGKDELLTAGDYKDKLQREGAWTKRQQAFAETRKALEADYAAKIQEVIQYAQAVQAKEQAMAQVGNPVEQLLKAVQQQQNPQTPVDPTTLATVGDLDQKLKDLHAQIENAKTSGKTEFETSLKEAVVELQQREYAKAERSKWLTGLNGILGKQDYKDLADVIPHFATAVEFEVKKANPQTYDEAIDVAEQYVKSVADSFKSRFQAQAQKIQAKVEQAKMEPSTGAAPALGSAKKASFIKANGQLDWTKLNKHAAETRGTNVMGTVTHKS